MAIDLKKFVDISMKYRLSTSANADRDTATLIINSSAEGDETYSSLDSVLEAFKTDPRFKIGGELYYYVYCFFKNGGNKLQIVSVAKDTEYKYTLITDETRTFSNDDLYAYYMEGNVQTYHTAYPTNSNANGSALYENAIVDATGTSFEVGVTYYMDNAGLIHATPVLCELYEATSEEPVTYVLTQDSAFVNGKTYYKDSAGSTVATPTNCSLFVDGYKPTIDGTFISDKTYYKNEQGTVATPKNCSLYTRTTALVALTEEDVNRAIAKLDYTKIVIASNATYGIMAKIAGSINKSDDFDMYSKIILSCIPEGSNMSNVGTDSNPIAYRGFVLKYGVCGVEMAIAAYLTQINADQYNSVEDYYFTTENVVYTIDNETSIGYICDDNELAEVLMEKQINFNSMLVNEVRNIGGNTTKDKDFVNEFMLILLHQTLTNRLVELLTQKIKYNQTGLSLIGAAISDELHRYLNNGYLTTEKSWTDPDLVIDGITVISKNTQLQLGYKYIILPFSTLTAEDRRQHKLPKIYIIIADSYAIRKIEITGEVI